MEDSRDTRQRPDDGELTRAGAARLSRSERREAKRALKRAKSAERARRRREGTFVPRKLLPTESYPGPLVLRGKRSAQDALGYEGLHEDGVIRVQEGTYSRVVEFEDLNFVNASDERRERIFSQWRSTWNGIDPSTKVQLKILCRRVDRREFLEDMSFKPVPGDPVRNSFRAEINRIIEGKVSDTRQNVERRRLLVLTVEQPDRESATAPLADAVAAAIRSLRGLGAKRAHALDGNELLEVINSITNPSDGRGAVSFDDLRCRDARGRTAALLGYTTRDLVAPTDVSRPDPAHISWGDQFGQALYIQKWGNTVKADMLATLAQLSVNQCITVEVRPWDYTNAIELVEGVSTDLKAQKTQYVLDHSQTMYISDEMLPSSLADALANVRDMRDDLHKRNELMFSVGVSILTWAPSEEELDRSTKLIKDTLRRFSYRAAPLKRLQGQGFAAALPTGRFDIPYTRTMTSSPLAALMPFSSIELLDRGGMYFGQNLTSKNFIFYDRASATSSNGFIFGMLGRGKSVAAKNMLLQACLLDPGADKFVIDPEGEWWPVVRALQGELVQVGAGTKAHFNPLDISFEGTDPEDGPLELKTDMIISAIGMMAGHLTELQKSLVDRCMRHVFERFVETRDASDIPLLGDLYEDLGRQPEPEAHELAVTIERYVVGQASLFNHATNVDLSNNLVCFDIRDNGKNMKPIVELFVLDTIWQRVVRNRALGRRTWIFIDEIHLICDNDDSVSYLDSLWRRARKYGAIPTGISQNPSSLLAKDKLKDMISNSDFLMLLGMYPDEAQKIGQARKLSAEEVDFLVSAEVGQGILCAEGCNIEFENELPEGRMLELFNTKPGSQSGDQD